MLKKEESDGTSQNRLQFNYSFFHIAQSNFVSVIFCYLKLPNFASVCSYLE